MTTPQELGLVTPTGTDYIRDGDNAITTNAQAVAEIFDAQAAKNNEYDNSLQYKTTAPSGDMATWYGLDKMGIYRFPGEAGVEVLEGAPTSAAPGQAFVFPIGSTTSTIYWVEFGENGRTFERTVSSNASHRTGWIERNRMKHVGTSLTLTGGNSPVVRTDFAGRVPINFGVDIDSWYLHIRNYNLRDSTSYTGSLNINGLSIGEAELDANGDYTGNWVAGTEALLQTAFTTPQTGSEYVTARFDYKLDKSKAYLLSYGFTAPAGQQVVEAMGGGFVLTNGSAAVHSVSTASTHSKTMPLMLWIEAVVPTSTPVKGLVADSLGVGVSSTYPVHDSWFSKWCRSLGALPVFWAASGDTMENFSNPLMWKFHQWEKMAKPDDVGYALGSNDDFGADATLAEMKTRFTNSTNALRPFTGNNMYVCSVWPRFEADDPQEVVRKQYNEWLETELPRGAMFYLNTAAPITNPDGTTLNKKWSASPTDIHLSTAGYGRVASNLISSVSDVERDTGSRDVSNMLLLSTGKLLVSRVGNMVNLEIAGVTPTAEYTSGSRIFYLPLGFRPDFRKDFPMFTTTNGTPRSTYILPQGDVGFWQGLTTDTYRHYITFRTDDPWPTTLPGVAT